MTSPVHDAVLVREATDRLLTTAAELDAPAVAAPSLLTGWTRGHVLAHLARNADALVRVLAGEPAYESAGARARAIERDASRSPGEHLDDLRAAAARFDEATAALGDAGEPRRQTPVPLREGERVPASAVPFHRLTEVELHHVDLAAGYGLYDLPAAFVERQLVALAERLDGHPGLPQSLELHADDGTVLRTGAPKGERTVVAGDPNDLVGWLSGRTTGTGLSSGTPLPALPPL